MVWLQENQQLRNEVRQCNQQISLRERQVNRLQGYGLDGLPAETLAELVATLSQAVHRVRAATQLHNVQARVAGAPGARPDTPASTTAPGSYDRSPSATPSMSDLGRTDSGMNISVTGSMGDRDRPQTPALPWPGALGGRTTTEQSALQLPGIARVMRRFVSPSATSGAQDSS
jgi:hypothetical protein